MHGLEDAEYVFLHTGKGYLRFYLGIENLILPILSYIGCHVRAVHWLYRNSCTWSSRDVIVSYNEIVSGRIQGLLEAYFQMKKQW